MANNPSSGGAGQPGQPGGTPYGPGATNTPKGNSGAPTPGNAELNKIVVEFLAKRGFAHTEAVFREEISNLDENGRPRAMPMDEMEGKEGQECQEAKEETTSAREKPHYLRALVHVEKWVEGSLDLYKLELSKILWPIFVYSYLDLLIKEHYEDAKQFMVKHRERFENGHGDELRSFATMTLKQHVRENSLAQLYLENKYRIPLNQYVTGLLFRFLEKDHDEEYGKVIISILNDRCRINTVERGPIEPFSFESIVRRAQEDLDSVEAQEGIPGLATGISNRDLLDNKAPLRLGPMPMEGDLRADVLPELEEEDRLAPPVAGTHSLVQEFNLMHPIKSEADDSPHDIPYPPSRARDVVMEVRKVRENRDRFKIEGRSGGVGPGISVCMYTVHNTLGSISCMDFSRDQKLLAVGTMDSYIRVWTMDGRPLQSILAEDADSKVNNRKLIGHSGPVYSVAFSEATENIERDIYGPDVPKVSTHAQLLLSCSADGQVRLWSLEVWTCLCVYKGHHGPIMSLSWGPHGHYFATGGWDTTVRIWSQDHASAQRICVGHDTPISALSWHPNGAYVFSASDEGDKSIRMWSLANGECVRIFTGHAEYISALECAPNGQLLASADIGGNIILWDMDKGVKIKKSRGHGRGGIWSLSFSVESNVLVSGGADNTVRVWDVEMPAEGSKPLGEAGDGSNGSGGGLGGADGKAAGASSQGGVGGKKKGKEVMITPDQISAFPTKRTPVIKVQFTRMNLVLAGGCYEPER